MKKYTSCATNWLAFATIISALILLFGIILIVAKTSNGGLQIGLTMLGGLMSILFLSCFLAEKSRYLTIDSKEIVLPRGVQINERLSFQRTAINMDEIRSIESRLYKGNGIISKDTYFYTLTLKDGTTFKFPLYAYGKEAEDEIIDILKKSI